MDLKVTIGGSRTFTDGLRMVTPRYRCRAIPGFRAEPSIGWKCGRKKGLMGKPDGAVPSSERPLSPLNRGAPGRLIGGSPASLTSWGRVKGSSPHPWRS
jgi:hypothetical protein